MTSPLELENVHVSYGDLEVVSDVSLSLKSGEVGCLLGPSGCGKTTLLRAIAGFEPVHKGKIIVGGVCISQPGEVRPPEKRGIGMVFQDFALFPHLSVEQNITFGLSSWSKADRKARVKSLLDLVELPDIGDKRPHQLSGGQQQRVALVRAMAPRPSLFLLDEPFSSMDAELREGLAREVRNILNEEGITSLLVTHDQMEAFAMADRIAVMKSGLVRQWDTSYNLYHKPVDRFVAGFVGQGVMLPVLTDDNGMLQSELGEIDASDAISHENGRHFELLLRPDDVIQKEDGVICDVVGRSFRGSETLYRLRLPSGLIVLYITHGKDNFEIGSTLTIGLKLDVPVLFPTA